MKTLNQLIKYLTVPRGLNSIYGHILQQTQQQIRPDLPTAAAVTVTPLGVWQLFWNPTILEDEPLNYQLLVLVHEAAHLSLNHLPRGLRLLRPEINSPQFELRKKQFQYAADLAVNSLVITPFLASNPLFKNIVSNIQDRWLFPGHFTFPDRLSLEEYYRLLQNNEDNSPEAATNPGGGTKNTEKDVLVDEILEEPDSTITQTIRTTEKEALHKLTRCVEISKKNCGSIPQHITTEIEYLETDPEIPWTSLLRDYARTTLNERITECIASPNAGLLHLADYGCEPFPGYSLDTTLRIAVFVDSSGSISTESDYKPFLRELAYLLDTHKGLIIHYIVFDSVIQEELLFTSTGRDDIVKHKLNVRPSQGGTNFLPPFKCIFGVAEQTDYDKHLYEKPRIVPKRPDLIIIMTDGYAEIDYPHGPYPQYLSDAIPNIWVLTKYHTNDSRILSKMQRIVKL